MCIYLFQKIKSQLEILNFLHLEVTISSSERTIVMSHTIVPFSSTEAVAVLSLLYSKWLSSGSEGKQKKSTIAYKLVKVV